MSGKTHIVIDPLYGNSGKGKVAALVALKVDAGLAVELGTGPSAAHEIWDEAGNVYVTRMVPPCYVNRGTRLAISKSLMIDPELLRPEVQALAPFDVVGRLHIDPRCKVADLRGASDLLAAEAVVRAGSRADALPEAASVEELRPYLADVDALVASTLAGGKDVVAVMQHGTCVTRGFGDGEVIEWPCTTGTALKELGAVGAFEVLLVVRAMPTRTQRGPLPNEIEWPAGIPRSYGKSSGRPMRIASAPDMGLLREVAAANRAGCVYLTFADFLDPEVSGVTEWRRLPERVKEFVRQVERRLSVAVRYVSTGAGLGQGVWLS